jgi:putative RNA 2'-phosphotransferase
MGRRKDPKQLYKLLVYILRHRPDEFGLVPHDGGALPVKELIQAIGEEPGWGYVRRSHLNEVLMTHRDHPFLLEGSAIGVADSPAVCAVSPDEVPKLLYHCVRRKAYPVVSRRGLAPMGKPWVVLSVTEEMALRIGRRRDPKPVLLTVQARRAAEEGIPFRRQGELLYIVNQVPTECFTGPPLSPEKTPAVTQTRETSEASSRIEPGSFALDVARSEALQRQAVKQKGIKKDIAWKKEARKARRRRR